MSTSRTRLREIGDRSIARAVEVRPWEKLQYFLTFFRLGVPEDIAGAVSFLVSDDAAYITGETLPVAGGYYCKL